MAKANELRAISEKYDTIFCRGRGLRRLGVIGIFSAVLIGIGSSLYAKTKSNPFESRPIVSRYKSANQTLESLGEARERESGLVLPYQPEHIEPKIKRVSESRQEMMVSLDTAIESVESDIEDIENDQKFQEYISWKYSSTGLNIVGGIAATVGAIGLLTWLGGFGYEVVNDYKRRKEIERVFQGE